MVDLNFNVGDTNFLAIVNTNRYFSYVDEDWDLKMLKKHFIKQTEQGNILVMQMTNEGIEDDWKIRVEFGDSILESECFRKDTGYIKVDNSELCFVEYTCLTMAAQFKDEKVPDNYCDKFRFKIDNGVYKVNITQFYDVDNGVHIGRSDVDILFQFIKVDNNFGIAPKVFWYDC